jgi:hypothetical protein
MLAPNYRHVLIHILKATRYARCAGIITNCQEQLAGQVCRALTARNSHSLFIRDRRR